MSELKPCPFCGCEEILEVHETKFTNGTCKHEYNYIECQGCFLEVKYSDCIASAVQLWNMRT